MTDAHYGRGSDDVTDVRKKGYGAKGSKQAREREREGTLSTRPTHTSL